MTDNVDSSVELTDSDSATALAQHLTAEMKLNERLRKGRDIVAFVPKIWSRQRRAEQSTSLHTTFAFSKADKMEGISERDIRQEDIACRRQSELIWAEAW